jgi:spartin
VRRAIAAPGVSRRAILKSVAKGMVVGNVKGGGQVIVGGDNSNVATIVPAESSAAGAANGNGYNNNNGGSVYGDNASIYSSQPLLDRQGSNTYKGPY